MNVFPVQTEALQDHAYAYGCNPMHDDPQDFSINVECQTDLTMEDIDALMEAKKKTENPGLLLKETFIAKVTENDASVRKYTGTPSKHFLNGIFGMPLFVNKAK